MQNISILKTFYCPDEYNLNLFKSSFFNNISYFSSLNKYIIEFHITGWVKKNYNDFIITFMSQIQQKYKNCIINYSIQNYNYGKQYIFKNILNSINYDNINSFILYIDHDIFIYKHLIPYDNMNNLLIFLINYFKNDSCKYAFLALNQDGDCRHHNNAYLIKDTLTDLIITRPDDNDTSSIASGCFFMKKNILNLLKNEIEIISLYGFDDMQINNIVRKHNYFAGILYNYNVVHNFHNNYDINDKYMEFKKQLIDDIIQKKTSYYDTIQKSYNFWLNFN